MYLALLSQYSTWVLVTLGVGVVISVVAFVVTYRTARKAPYFAWREEAAARARRVLGLIFILLLAVGGTVWARLAVSPQFVAAIHTPSPSATPSGGESSSKSTGAPSPSPMVTRLTPISTATMTVAPISTRAPPTPTATSRPADVEARIEFLSFARGVSESNQPIGPAAEFTANAGAVYAFFKYSHMADSAKWTYIWLSGTIELTRETRRWEWGQFGQAYLFFGPPGGYDPGKYHLQIYAEDRLLLDAGFTVE